jgi:hypothetical protein
MAIISFDQETIIDFVPEYAGNRESKDPCIVRLKYVSYAKIQAYSRSIVAQSRGGKIDSEAVAGVQEKQFCDSVAEVINFSVVKPDGTIALITDAKEFYQTAPAELIIEIIKAMESSAKLTEGQRKNFEAASASA